MSIFSPMYWELQRDLQPGLCPLEVVSWHGLPSIGPGSSLRLHLHLCHSLIYKPWMAPCFSVGNAKLVDIGPSLDPFCQPPSLSSWLSGPPVHTTARNLYYFQAVSLFTLFPHFGLNALPHWLHLFISAQQSPTPLPRPSPNISSLPNFPQPSPLLWVRSCGYIAAAIMPHPDPFCIYHVWRGQPDNPLPTLAIIFLQSFSACSAHEHGGWEMLGVLSPEQPPLITNGNW